ncbi:MAG TPA: nucleoside hydrolase [Spirochaetia bacterium]|nr:nucleoside hydrolase [Spirochaetia bacterium]
MERIILDTDIGDDIDDAFALTLVVRSPELSLAGVTTVFRNAERRAKLSLKLLSTLGVSGIPVLAGCDTPFVEGFRAQDRDTWDPEGRFIPCQYATDYDGIRLPSDEHAVDFIIRTVREQPGQIVLVTIGPLTNAAMALRKAPDIASKLKSITMMGGYRSENAPEWNILCDPEAARIVFTAGAPIAMVGLDVTLQCSLSLQEVDRLRQAGSDGLGLLYELTQKWLAHSGAKNPILHDPLAVATLIDESVVRFEPRLVQVALEGTARGCTLTRTPPDPAKDRHYGKGRPEQPPCRVASAVDAARFKTLFLGRVLSGSR